MVLFRNEGEQGGEQHFTVLVDKGSSVKALGGRNMLPSSVSVAKDCFLVLWEDGTAEFMPNGYGVPMPVKCRKDVEAACLWGGGVAVATSEGQLKVWNGSGELASSGSNAVPDGYKCR